VPPALFLVVKMLNAILGIKKEVGQRFTQDGSRIPVTRVKAGPCYVVQIRNEEKDGYHGVQIGWGEKKMTKIKKPLKGHLRGAKLEKAPRFLREVRLEKPAGEGIKVGEKLKLSDIFQPGDQVKVTGQSKGKGFTGVMKRWGFKGGPRTHGQSDRERAPGSIGQGTTPGRVHKGKKMPGRAGNARVAIKGLIVQAVDEENEELLIKGLVPGARNGLLIITKTGKAKRFVPLMEKGKKEIEETEEQRAERLRREKEAKEALAAAETTEVKSEAGQEAKPEKKKEEKEEKPKEEPTKEGEDNG
jgi:large subunit ribosomal protein L3